MGNPTTAAPAPATAATPAPVTEEERSLQSVMQDVRKILDAYDTNKDGKLDSSEIAAMQKDYAELMRRYDRNHNRKLDPWEMKLLERHAAGGSRAQQQRKQVLVTIMKRYDQNLDGTLDEKEIRALLHDIKTTDMAVRYSGYSAALARVLRYAAFTSDLGESFRPIAHPRVVTASYGVSWAYVLGDVAYEGFKEQRRGKEPVVVANTVARRALFQCVASMLIPAVLIHTQVKIFKGIFGRIGRFQKWGPTMMGLALIPILPVFDHPVEHAVDNLFDRFWPMKIKEH